MEAFGVVNCSDGPRLDMSNGNHTAKKSSRKELRTASSTELPSSAISEHSSVKGTPKAIRGWLMSLPQDSHVSRTVEPVKVMDDTTIETYGPKQHQLFESLNPDTRYSKMSSRSQGTNISQTSSRSLPRWGMTASGRIFQPPKLEPRTVDRGFGYWPTPTVEDAMRQGSTKAWGEWIEAKRTTCYRLRNAVGDGYLNPTWVEWLMGWPLGSTDLEPLGMDKYHEFLLKHGKG